MDGRPYVVQDVEPYTQFWLSERERLLLALFARRGGSTQEDATRALLRLTLPGTEPGSAAEDAERRRIARAVAGMLQVGVLMQRGADTSRYSQRIVRDYVAHRPFPSPVAQTLVQAAGIGAGTRVLDLAGGPGCLALALARQSNDVTLMELSHGFLAAARQRARQQGLALQTVHDSCNRLPQRDDAFDVITVSQALHWLDDVAVCRGVNRLLRAGGSFCIVHSAIDLPDAHPLAYLLGHDSVLGAKARVPFVEEVQALQRRVGLLLQALGAAGADRIDPLGGGAAGAAQRAPVGFAGAWFFDQQRPFDEGYARGFLTPAHIAVTGQAEPAFWADLRRRTAQASPQALQGVHRWAVLHFQRGAAADGDLQRCVPQAMAYQPAA